MAAQSHEKTILLIKGLFKRQMQDKAFQLIDKELKRLKGLANEDFYHHFYQFQLWELKQDYTLDTMKIDENIYTNLINNLDLFYIDTKLRFEYIVKERNIYYGDSYERLLCKDIKCIINNFEIERMTQSTILYSKLFQLPDDFCLKKFDKVKSFYFEHFDKFSFSNKKDFFNHLFNYCIDGYKNGIKFFLKEAFELKKFALKKKINFENGQISTIDFTNFVVISSTLKDYDWALQFIDQYAKYLPEDRKQSIVQISKAQIECDLPNPDFNKVIDLLKDAEYFNTYDNIQARSLMLRAYYQLNEWHTLTYFLDAFHKFLDRNTTIGKEDKVGFKNMIKFTRILIKTQYKKPPKVELLNGLEALKPIRAKQWLTNRINELFDE